MEFKLSFPIQLAREKEIYGVSVSAYLYKANAFHSPQGKHPCPSALEIQIRRSEFLVQDFIR